MTGRFFEADQGMIGVALTPETHEERLLLREFLRPLNAADYGEQPLEFVVHGRTTANGISGVTGMSFGWRSAVDDGKASDRGGPDARQRPGARLEAAAERLARAVDAATLLHPEDACSCAEHQEVGAALAAWREVSR